MAKNGFRRRQKPGAGRSGGSLPDRGVLERSRSGEAQAEAQRCGSSGDGYGPRQVGLKFLFFANVAR